MQASLRNKSAQATLSVGKEAGQQAASRQKHAC